MTRATIYDCECPALRIRVPYAKRQIPTVKVLSLSDSQLLYWYRYPVGPGGIWQDPEESERVPEGIRILFLETGKRTENNEPTQIETCIFGSISYRQIKFKKKKKKQNYRLLWVGQGFE